MSKKNTNPNVVVMSKEAYQTLLSLAEVGTQELGEQRLFNVLRKIRRWNQPLIDQYQLISKEKKQEESIIKENVKYLLRFSGQIVFINVTKNIYRPIKIISRAYVYANGRRYSDDMLGYLKCNNIGSYRSRQESYYYTNIVTELPDNHAHILEGEYKDCFVFPDGYRELNQSTWLKKSELK